MALSLKWPDWSKSDPVMENRKELDYFRKKIVSLSAVDVYNVSDVPRNWPLAKLSRRDLIVLLVGVLYKTGGVVRFTTDLRPEEWNITVSHNEPGTEDPLCKTLGIWIEPRQEQ